MKQNPLIQKAAKHLNECVATDGHINIAQSQEWTGLPKKSFTMAVEALRKQALDLRPVKSMGSGCFKPSENWLPIKRGDRVYKGCPWERQGLLLTEKACFARAELWSKVSGFDRHGDIEAGGCLRPVDKSCILTFTDMHQVEVDRRTGRITRLGRAEA